MWLPICTCRSVEEFERPIGIEMMKLDELIVMRKRDDDGDKVQPVLLGERKKRGSWSIDCFEV